MSIVNATPVDWSVVIFILVATAGVLGKWVVPSFMSLKAGGGTGGGIGPSGQIRPSYELGQIEQLLHDRTSFFESMVVDQRRLAEEQSKLTTVLDDVHRKVGVLEERSRGQAEMIRTILDEKRIHDAVEERLARAAVSPPLPVRKRR
jgi:hypothetical protein